MKKLILLISVTLSFVIPSAIIAESGIPHKTGWALAAPVERQFADVCAREGQCYKFVSSSDIKLFGYRELSYIKVAKGGRVTAVKGIPKKNKFHSKLIY